MIVEDKFYVGYRDVDTNLKIKNSAILNFFEDIAGMHAAKAGEGATKTGTTWLLIGYKVKVFKRPVHGEKVNVLTWGTEIKGITAAREFEIRSIDTNELLITGLSNWAHINVKSKKLERVSDELAAAYEREDRTNFNETRLKKLVEPKSFEYEKEQYIDWNWIDANNHMNNIFYMDLVDIVIPDEMTKNNEFNYFEIMYKKEIKYKDTVRCLYSEDDECCTITIKSKDTDELHSIIKLYKKSIDNA